jgi:hypothetical protein
MFRRWLWRTRRPRMTVLLLGALLLVPWIGYLAVSLPRRYVMTADGDDIALSLATALVVELPLAALLVVSSLQRLRTLVGEDARHP